MINFSPNLFFVLFVIFIHQGAGTYMCDVTLKSVFDIRVYRLEMEVISQGTHAVLEFATPVCASKPQPHPTFVICWFH